jgi:tetraacyldisaccharide-1-P 4'-kinase
VTSVAFPHSFRQLVERLVGGPVQHLEDSDHHAYTAADAGEIQRLADRAWVATTEKDAVKLAAFRELLPDVRVLPLVPEPPPNLGHELSAALDARFDARTKK